MSASDIESLISMGFTEEIARAALSEKHTLEEAIQLILSGGSDYPAMGMGGFTELKMVCVVRVDLGMTAGKIASQCVHAALGAYRIIQETDPQTLQNWESTEEKVVCLKSKSFEELESIYLSAKAAGITTYLIHDAGRTQIEPGSATVVAVGPAAVELINSITGHLKLY